MHSTSGACRGAALPAFLLAHPPAKAEQVSEAALEPMVAVDLAGNVADDAAQIGLERAQSPVGALELPGMGVTLMLDQGELADPRISTRAAIPASRGTAPRRPSMRGARLLRPHGATTCQEDA